MPLGSLRGVLQRLRKPIGSFPPAPLPLELWERILGELTYDDLISAAHVCRAFNDRCIAIHLRRNGVAPELTTSGTLHIRSHLLLFFQLARLPPRLQIHTVVCHFWTFHILRDMKALQSFIRRSPGLTGLRLSFVGNLMKAHTYDTYFPYSQRALMTELCDIIRRMVRISAAPVFVVGSGHLYHATPRDLAAWGFRHFVCRHAIGRVAWFDRARAVLKPKDMCPNLYLPVHLNDDRQKLVTRSLHSIELRAIPSTTYEAGPLTLIEFDTDSAKELELGGYSRDRYPDIYGPALAAILPLLTLPALRNLTISKEVDPTLLSQFLERHPSIRTIELHYSATSGDAPAEQCPTGTHLWQPAADQRPPCALQTYQNFLRQSARNDDPPRLILDVPAPYPYRHWIYRAHCTTGRVLQSRSPARVATPIFNLLAHIRPI
ncbi:hypothetical protein B0H15DRAFT_821016 [Mycena belliarum]|uniref:F-box domain-containing protein n=1 Tax=Mycena belliarum TaxID=1033014 RepID=A0AAD6UH22_9AGAR|nr:hypothetical protein B0H15DRAFT_821016 [Mycena belliae]